ncbi:MAG: hypothetical protein AAF354_10845, partial [Pseudomonadota bacterium]
MEPSFRLTSIVLISGLALGWALFAPGAPLQHFGDALTDIASPQAAFAEDKEVPVSPTKVSQRPRDTYFPNTEDLKPDEMRVIACGTGMPTTRAAQAAACFLVELGNGDKFLFDIGSGSAERISSLQIPYNYLDKVCIGHLH